MLERPRNVAKHGGDYFGRALKRRKTRPVRKGPVHMHIDIHMHLRIDLYLHIHIHVHIHRHVHIHTTRTHTYTYTYGRSYRVRTSDVSVLNVVRLNLFSWQYDADRAS